MGPTRGAIAGIGNVISILRKRPRGRHTHCADDDRIDDRSPSEAAGYPLQRNTGDAHMRCI